MKIKFAIYFYLLICSLTPSLSSETASTDYAQNLEQSLPENVYNKFGMSKIALQKWMQADGFHFDDPGEFYQMHYQLRTITNWVTGQSSELQQKWIEFLFSLNNIPIYFDAYRKSFTFNSEPILALFQPRANLKLGFKILRPDSKSVRDDLRDIFDLRDYSFDFFEDDDSLEKREGWVDYVLEEDYLLSEKWIIARDLNTGQIAASMVVHCDENEVIIQFRDGSIQTPSTLWRFTDVAVGVNFLGARVGAMLFQYVEDELQLDYASIDVHRENLPAIKLYEQVGFVSSLDNSSKNYIWLTRNYLNRENYWDALKP